MFKKIKGIYFFLVLYVCISLLSSLSRADQFTLIDPEEWMILGTVSEYQNTLREHKLVIGDELGKDPSDTDQDDNLWNSIASGSFSPHDYDALVSKVSFRPPVRLYFHGYLSTSQIGFQEAGLAYKNPDFTGDLTGELPIGTKLAYFSLNYKSPEILQTGVYTGGQESLAPVKLYGQDDKVDQEGLVWGQFEIYWDGHDVVFKRNGQTVRTEPLEYDSGRGVVAYFRNYDHPFEFESISFEGEALEGATEDESGGKWQVKEHLKDLCSGGIYFLTENRYLCTSGRDIYLRTLEGEDLASHIGNSTQDAPVNNLARTSQGTLYAFGGDDRGFGTAMVLLRSTDGGYHWEFLNDNIRDLTEYNVALGYGQAFYDPASGRDIIYVRTGVINTGTVLKSYDSGRSWQKVWNRYLADQYPKCPNDILKMHFATTTSGVVVVESDPLSAEDGKCPSSRLYSDVYLTEDGGSTWRKLFGLQDLVAQLRANGTLSDEHCSVVEVIWSGEKGYLRVDGNPQDFVVSFDRNGNHRVLLLGQPGEQVTINDLYYSPAHGLFLSSYGKVYHLKGSSWEEVYAGKPKADFFLPLFLNDFPPRMRSGYDDVLVMEQASTVKVGDTSGDGKITIVDALFVARHIVGLTVSRFDASAADVNCDGHVNIIDALSIARKAVGLQVKDWCGK